MKTNFDRRSVRYIKEALGKEKFEFTKFTLKSIEDKSYSIENIYTFADSDISDEKLYQFDSGGKNISGVWNCCVEEIRRHLNLGNNRLLFCQTLFRSKEDFQNLNAQEMEMLAFVICSDIYFSFPNQYVFKTKAEPDSDQLSQYLSFSAFRNGQVGLMIDESRLNWDEINLQNKDDRFLSLIKALKLILISIYDSETILFVIGKYTSNQNEPREPTIAPAVPSTTSPQK